MRRIGYIPPRTAIGIGLNTSIEGHPKMWVQLREEAWNVNTILYEIVQQLKDEMARLREDNERLMQEEENILKSLFERQNHRKRDPNRDFGNITRIHKQRDDNLESEGHQEVNGEESDKVSDYKNSKKQKQELQGEFNKIKPPIFDGEQEEATKA